MGMDHLQFGHEYVSANMPGFSGRVLLLHSIMGLGNNYFPLERRKIPQLQSMLTGFEMRHIEAFPSIVRLWCAGVLPDELLKCTAERMSLLKRVTFHRIMDNKELSMDADDFWIHLNYQ